uniref:E3 UFM1-protein ligase 1 homolog n=1 Tax=Clastoptera arizonana TaxID=38151 RepID=A0A1B6D5T8_9HEMI
MSSVDWEEVKRLAADFQRAQLSVSSQRLTERNCIEVITKLIESKLLEVYFTTDGKEYITPQQLTKEIKDELYVQNGRINLVELARILNVDLSQISNQVAEIERGHGYTVVLGQLIDKKYIGHIAEEINERLIQQGQVTIPELTRVYDLPSDFLQSVVEKQLGKTINAKQDKQDSHTFYTDAFVTRNKAIVRGALIAATKPTPVTAILNQCNISEGTFNSVIDSLIEAKQIAGILTGRQSGAATFVPHIYSKAQNEWIDNFYKQNGYVEYDALSRLGIQDPQTFVKRHFVKEKLLLLPTCAVGKQLLDQIEGSVEEAIVSSSWVDILPLLPSVLEVEDAEIILKEVQKSVKSSLTTHTFCSTVVVTDQFLQSLLKPFHEEIIQKKAEEAVTSGKYQQFQTELKLGKSTNSNVEIEDSKADRRDERRKKATGGKVGGGTQGRETKTKSTKKKQRARIEASDSEDEKTTSSSKLNLISLIEIQNSIVKSGAFEELDSDELVQEISSFVQPDLNKAALQAASIAYENIVLNRNSSRRKTHSDTQDKLNVLVNDIRLYEKAIKHFSSKDTQGQLVKYLLKTTGTELVNYIFTLVAQDNCSHQPDATKELTPEARQKVLNEIPTDIKDPLTKLHKAVGGSSLDDFMAAVDPAFAAVDLMLRKPDKKKERPQLLAHRQALLQQLESTDDPALVLHVTCLILFQACTQTMIQASGRFVSVILQYLAPQLSIEINQSLKDYHDLVMKLLKIGDDENEKSQTISELQNKIDSIKKIAINFKKNSISDKS